MRMHQVSDSSRQYRPSRGPEVFVSPNLVRELATDLVDRTCCVPHNQIFDVGFRRAGGISTDIHRHAPVGVEDWRALAAAIRREADFLEPDIAALGKAESDGEALEALTHYMAVRNFDCLRYSASIRRKTSSGRHFHEVSWKDQRPSERFCPPYLGDIVAVGEAFLVLPHVERRCMSSNAMLNMWKPSWVHVGPPDGDMQWIGVHEFDGVPDGLAIARAETRGNEIDLCFAREMNAVVDWAFDIAWSIKRPMRIFVGDGRSNPYETSVEAVDLDPERLSARFVTCAPPRRDSSFRKIEAEDTAAVSRLIHYRTERQRLKDESGEAPAWMTFRG